MLDTLTDITIRYLNLLCNRSLSFSYLAHSSDQNDIAECQPRIEDIRMALESMGMLRPMRVFDFPEEDVGLGILNGSRGGGGYQYDYYGEMQQEDRMADYTGSDPAVEEFLEGIKEIVKGGTTAKIEITGLEAQTLTDEDIRRDVIP